MQLTNDGHKACLEALDGAFGGNVDYVQLMKMYGNAPKPNQTSYNPSKFNRSKKTVIEGNFDEQPISKSYVERQNLTMSMSTRRLNRLTSTFSK